MTESRLLVIWGSGEQEVEITKGNQKAFGNDGHVHYLDCGDCLTGINI